MVGDGRTVEAVQLPEGDKIIDLRNAAILKAAFKADSDSFQKNVFKIREFTE